ncbi:TPA: hypothetical protein MYP23_005262, partial [Klebsiella quasipneumoniae]|nr:hypothetical protein [Klebsiella quasipneumoniae]
MVNRYNTGNPRPSNSMKDLSDNAQAYDDFMNSEDDTFIDRLENEKDTLAGAQKKMAAAAEASVQDARQNLIPLSRQYTTLADAQADIANLPVNSFTYVRDPSGNALALEYQNVAGVLTATGRKMPSRSSMVIGIVDSWVNNNLYPFDSLSSPNENAVSMNVAAVSTIAYREAYSALLSPVAVGDIITVRYKYNGTGGAPTIGLKTSLNGTFVSNQPTLTSSNDWQEVQLTATAATATLLAIGVNTRLATTVQLSIIAYASKKNAITTAIINSLDSISSLNGKVR